MESLVEYIAKSLVEDPSQVAVEQKNSGSSIIIELRVAQEDTGRVIGKNGRVADAIRSLLRVMSDNSRKRVILKIV